MLNDEYQPGDLVYLKRSLVEGPPELLTILWKVPPDDDEADTKYLVRTASHAKKTVFHCEITHTSENKKEPAHIPKN